MFPGLDGPSFCSGSILRSRAAGLQRPSLGRLVHTQELPVLATVNIPLPLIASSMPPLLAQLKRSLCELLANHQLSWGLSTFSQAPVSEDRWFQPGQVKSCLPTTLADLDVVVVEISDVKKQVCSFCTCCRGWGRPSSRRRQ